MTCERGSVHLVVEGIRPYLRCDMCTWHYGLSTQPMDVYLTTLTDIAAEHTRCAPDVRDEIPVPDLADFAAFKVGDILIMRPHMDLTPNQAREYENALQPKFPHARVVVLLGPTDVSILRPE